MKAYSIEYKNYNVDEIKRINVLANNKQQAYIKAVYDILPEPPYSAWVASVTYQNGNYRKFNNFEGNPY